MKLPSNTWHFDSYWLPTKKNVIVNESSWHPSDIPHALMSSYGVHQGLDQITYKKKWTMTRAHRKIMWLLPKDFHYQNYDTQNSNQADLEINYETAIEKNSKLALNYWKLLTLHEEKRKEKQLTLRYWQRILLVTLE